MTLEYQLCLAEYSFDLSGKYKGYNVILIISDALRPDRLSCYGYPKETSPHIDLLAQQGVLFNNAFSQSALTLPSVVSIFTSLYPFSHGVSYVFKDKVPEKFYTLAQILKIYGYSTVWFGTINDPHTGKGNGLLKGFNEKYDLWEHNSIKENYSGILNWLKKHRKKPFFISVHSYLTHEKVFPFRKFNNEFTYNISNNFRDFFKTMPEKWWKNLQSMLQNNQSYIYKILGEEWIKKHKEYFMQPYSSERVKNIFKIAETPEQKYELKIIYSETYSPYFKYFDAVFLSDFYSLLDGAIFELDKNLIRELISELKRFKIYDKTIIIITADHGNEYNEHGHIGHGQFLYDESIRVPLIFYLPGFGKAKKIDTLVQSIDILPTTLDLLGIPAPHQTQGMSLVGLIDGTEDIRGRQYVFSQSIDGKYMVRAREWKFIDNPIETMQDELYNLTNDPKEQDNLIRKDTEIAKNLQERLLEWKKTLPSYTDNAKQQFVPYIDKETQERIRRTGYW